ncbi:MAG: ABC-ATPase domain-containing protein [bacterium]|nr:ABC-ATPase domain-containing protein [bacterium]
MQNLKRILSKIDGCGYKVYKRIEGTYKASDFTLYIDHVQSDPFAPPTQIRIRVSQDKANFPEETYTPKIRNIGLVDYLTRQVWRNIQISTQGKRGTGKSGLIFIDKGKQQVLERNSIIINHRFVEARIGIGLPAAGRRILGREAWQILGEVIPKIAKASLIYNNLNQGELMYFIKSVEDQEFLRSCLPKKRLVSFIANQSLLPRVSGVDDRPLKDGIPFVSPSQLEVWFVLPNQGKIKGMGIPEGVTLIVGGGYHGKSTLLRAIQLGVYNHIPHDGRERVVTIPDAVKIRAEDGRRVEGVDISPFINNLPNNRPTERFSTENASGSTSQAANIIEALEMGARLLLIDEDTSATNFMIRDEKMRRLVHKEPITPFIDKVKALYKDYGVSTILVMGGCGDYFQVADTVIMMEEYEPRDVTQEAKHIALSFKELKGAIFGKINSRSLFLGKPDSDRKFKISTKGQNTLLYGKDPIDLSAVEQIVDESQTRAIGYAIYYLVKNGYLNGQMSIREALDQLILELEEKGLDMLSPFGHRDYVLPRKHEIACAINRLRSTHLSHPECAKSG